MTIAFAESSQQADTSTTFTHSQTISDGNLLVLQQNQNGDASVISLPTGGATWLQAYEGIGHASETHRMAVFYKVASSEPSTYTIDPNGNQNTTHLLRFTGTFDTDPIDSTNAFTTGSGNIINAATITIVDNAVAVTLVGGDSSTGALNTIDDSYIVAETTANRVTGSGYRIYVAGAGATGTIAHNMSRDILWAINHVSFKESAGGGATDEHFLMTLGVGQ